MPGIPAAGTAQSTSRCQPWCVILGGGLLAGTVDIGMAAWINMLDPRIILRFVAGGAVGAMALKGGVAMPMLGLALQWGMSIVIAAMFVIAAMRLNWLTTRPVLAGVAYGVLVFVVMNYVVMPLSAWHRVNHFAPVKGLENLAAMVLFGLIVAGAARWGLGASGSMRRR